MSPCKYCKVNKDRLCFCDVQFQGMCVWGGGVKFRILAGSRTQYPYHFRHNLKSFPATDHNSKKLEPISDQLNDSKTIFLGPHIPDLYILYNIRGSCTNFPTFPTPHIHSRTYRPQFTRRVCLKHRLQNFKTLFTSKSPSQLLFDITQYQEPFSYLQLQLPCKS